MKPYEHATNATATVDHLDQLSMRPDQRLAARATLRQAEMVAEMLMRAHADLSQVFGLLRRIVSAPAQRDKLSAVRPEPN